LQRDEVVDRAIEMADAEGLEAVTIRRLAQELGVTPMALYWHFADKDALLAAVSERLWDEVAADLATGSDGFEEVVDPWAALRAITEGLIGVLRRRPGCATLAPLAVLSSPSGLDITERTLSILEAAGIDGSQAAELAHFLLSTAITLVSTRPGGDVSGEDLEDALRAKRVALASLPPGRYPHVAAMADDLVDCVDVDGYFARAVEFLLGGMRLQVLEATGSDGAPVAPFALAAEGESFGNPELRALGNKFVERAERRGG
jgi:TetR/AcrR family tetracycline transcriptional repressor